MVVKRKRRRKFTPPKRKTNTSIKRHQAPPLHYTPLTVNLLLSQVKVMSLKPERLVRRVVLESSWPNIGTDTTVELVTPPSRWMLKPSKRTKKS
jgi:hypothetical protein